MSDKQKKSSKKPAIDRPFDLKVLRRAREIADGYHLILHFEDGEYYGRALEMPDVMNALKRLTINILSQEFNENGVINISIRQSESEQTILHFRALVLKKSVEEAQMREDTEGVLIELK